MDFQKLSPLELRDLINNYSSDLRKLNYQVAKTQAMLNELEGHLAEADIALGLEWSEAPAKAPEKAAPKPATKKAASKSATKKAPEKAAPKPAAEKKSEDKPKRRGRPAGSKNKTTLKKTKSASTGKTKTKTKGRGRPPGSKNKSKVAADKAKASKPTASKKTEQAATDDTPGYRLSEWDNFILKSLKEKQKVLTTSALTKTGVSDSSIKLGSAQIKTKLNASLHKLANKKGMLVKVEHSGRGFAYALQEWVSESGELPKKYVD
jgi:hypothetical protein